MLRKTLFITLFLQCFLFQRPIYAKCDFETGKYIKELNNPNSIKSIDIKVNNFRKYTINTFNSLLSNKVDRNLIEPQYKKKFKANINVNYEFGICKYKGDVRQTGDFKDHIKVLDNKNYIRSLKVNLEEGNVFNATRFKLFIPETRRGNNEILASIILRNLGIIAPETFEVNTNINNVNSTMIFQEDSQKELLERNFRREGPIFEGDESLIWDVKLRSKKSELELETSSLSRLINRNWFLKGENSQFITLNSYLRLQNLFMNYGANFPNYFLSPNNKLNNDFQDYRFLMLSMSDNEHALYPHNRKFFFNSFLSEFEPIYYDGNIDFSKTIDIDKEEFSKYNFNNDYVFKFYDKLNSPIFFKKIEDQFKKRILYYSDKEEKLLSKRYKNFLKNLKIIQNKINISKENKQIYKKYQDSRNSFLIKNAKFGIEKNIINNFVIDNKKVLIFTENGKKYETDLNNFSKILARRNINNEKFLFLISNPKYNKINNLLKDNLDNSNAEIIYPKGTKLAYQKRKGTTILSIYLSNPNDSVIIKGGEIKNYQINLKGPNQEAVQLSLSQRFNKRGLTGCLNIYDVNLDQVSFDIENVACEDSLNIINSKGKINSIRISNAYQDALDLDFSNISIKDVIINKSGNDCIDLSSGNYFIQNINLNQCIDKAISVGEKSSFTSKNIFIDSSNIGIAVKDLSIFKNYFSKIINTPICLELFQKKQEFGGAYAEYKNIECNGKFNVDKNSFLNLNYYEL